MKQLKYIKLFEAFESIKLTKTLGYIDTKSRVDFINYLKRLCKNSDFPISSLSDDMFQYLPYSKALKVNVKKEQKACTATSMSEFDRSYAIEGEKCEGGRIKRMWGSRQRVVECPHCGGTGIEPEKDDIKIMKFWFSKDGKLINTTGCDGSVKSVDTSHKGLIQGDVITSTERGYTNKLSRIPDLTKVSFRKSSRSESIPGIFYAYDSDNFFIIQDSYDGGTPPGSAWRRYGRFSWNISGGDFYTITIMSKIDKEEEDEEGVINPLLYNYPIIWNWRGINLEKWKNVETEIKDAHFALVLNLDKIKHGDYKTVTRIQDERTELKSGSKLDPKQSDESIRKENINRYLKKIAEKADLAADITNVKSVTNRIISGPLALFVVTKHGTNFEGILSRIINRYVDLMRCKEDDDRNESEYAENLKSYIKSRYEVASKEATNIRTVLDYCKKQFEKDSEGPMKYYEPISMNKHAKLLSELEDVSKLLHQKIMSLPFDCIEDLEIVKSKIIVIRNIFSSSDYSLNNLTYFLDAVLNGRTSRAYQYLVEEYRLSGENLEKTLAGLQTVKKIISRL